MYGEDSQLTWFAPDTFCGKTCRAHSAPEPPAERISGSSSKKSAGSRTGPYLFLDLRRGGGNLLGPCWERDSPSLGAYWMLGTGPKPHNGDGACSLSQILQENPPPKYYLSRTACLGILRRARERGKPLPPRLEQALKIQAGLDKPRSEENHETFTASFSAGAGAKAGGIAYSERVAPTLRGSDGGNRVPGVLCLNDQGGSRMDCGENLAGSLRAQEHGHQPLVFENHGIDARYTGPHTVAPTMSARYGTGGNNVPLVMRDSEPAICIMGNAIHRQPHNGGNGLGIQEELAYTLTSADRHAVFSRQRVDVFGEDGGAASTQSARQHKDATDLILNIPAQNQPARLIRRLTPLECERLQGFPDGWTEIPGASDSARYKALGNSVCVPCVEYIMRGIAFFLGQTPGE